MAGSSLIGNLAVNLSMETASFQRSATIAEKRAQSMQGKFLGVAKSIGSIGASFGAGILVGGLSAAAGGAFEMASALSEGAEKLGLTVEGLQRLRIAAQETGISNEQLDSAVTRLNKSMGELQLGSKSAVTAFAQIGLSADDLRGKKPDEALRIIADALNKIPDPQQRIAIGSQIMGKGFAQLIPLINGGSAALDQYAAQSQKNGEISTQNAKKLDELADTWEGLKTRVGVATANLIAGGAEFFNFYNNALIGLGNKTREWDAALASMARNALANIGNMVSGIANWMGAKLDAVWDSAKAKIKAVGDAFYNLYDRVVGHSDIPDMVMEIGDWMGRLQQVMVDPAATAADKVGAIFGGLRNVIADTFGSKAGGIVDIIGQFAMALSPILFGGNTSTGSLPSVGGSAKVTAVPKLARGGSGTFGGIAGVDKNLLSMNGRPIARVSRGEHFAVSPNAGGGVTINQHFAPNFAGNAATKQDLVMMGQMAKAETMAAIREVNRRR